MVFSKSFFLIVVLNVDVFSNGFFFFPRISTGLFGKLGCSETGLGLSLWKRNVSSKTLLCLFA